MPTPFFATFIEDSIARADTNQSGLANRWGVAESTMRNWTPRPGNLPPKSDPTEVLRGLMDRMSPLELMDLGQRLFEHRGFQVSPVATDGASPAGPFRIKDLEHAAMAHTVATVALQSEIASAAEDNVIDANEQTRIFNRHTTLEQAKHAVSWLVRHVPVMRRVS